MISPEPIPAGHNVILNLDTPVYGEKELSSDEGRGAPEKFVKSATKNPAKKSRAEWWMDQVEIAIAICCFAGFGVLSRLGLADATKSGRPAGPDFWQTVPANPLSFEGLASAFLTSNMLGTFIIGFFSMVPDDLKYKLHIGVTVGYCGSLTTFSSFICEAVQSSKKGPNSFGLVMTKIVNTLCVCVCAWLSGRFFAQILINMKIHHRFMVQGQTLDRPVVADDVRDVEEAGALQSKSSGSNNKSASKSSTKLLKDRQPEKLKYNLEFITWLLMILTWVTVVTFLIVEKDWKENHRFDYGIAVLVGFAGAYLRYWLSVLLNPTRNGFFWGTFACNMLGTLILILFKRYEHTDGKPSDAFTFGICNGFCASFTTVSSFINDIFKGFKRSLDQEKEAIRKKSLTNSKSSIAMVEDYHAGFWSAFSPVVYLVATLGVGAAIVSCFALT